jgi:predicted enzyme related to lactoylglutathione lyase
VTAPLPLLVNIDVEDLHGATQFYCDAFQLRVGRRFDAGAVELLGATAAIYLLQKPAGSQPTPQSAPRRDYGRHWTPVHVDFVVPELDAAVARATRAGAMLDGAARDNVWGRIAMLADPFGNGFCLIQFLGRGYDEIATE